MKYLALLSGLQQIPVVNTEAKGKVQVKLEENYLSVKGHFESLSSPLVASHFHHSGVGSNILPIEFELHPTLSADGKSGTWNEKIPTHKKQKLTEEEKEALRTGNYYINVHSQDHLFTGEIRGQLLPYVKCGSQYISNLRDGEREIGTFLASLNKNILTISGAFSHLTSLFVSLSINLDEVVVFGLNVNVDVPAASGTASRHDNRFCLSSTQYEALENNLLQLVLTTQSSQISDPLLRLL